VRDVTFTEAVGALVKLLRGDISQTELGKKADIPQSSVSAIELGNRDFAARHLERILAATNTSGMAAIRLLLAEAEKLQHVPAPVRKPRSARVVPVDRRVAAAVAKVQQAQGAGVEPSAQTKPARTRRTRR
jgi:hypothetical protein